MDKNNKFIEDVFRGFDNFKNLKECFAIRGQEISGKYDDYITSPLPDERLKKEWDKIEKNSPIPLPKDYKELFSVFGGGWIEDHRENYMVLPYISFWTWDDIVFFNDESIDEFWQECPNMIPFGDEAGDRFYIYGEGPEGVGIYYCEFGCGYYMDSMVKLADSFTALFTDKDTQEKAKSVL